MRRARRSLIALAFIIGGVIVVALMRGQAERAAPSASPATDPVARPELGLPSVAGWSSVIWHRQVLALPAGALPFHDGFGGLTNAGPSLLAWGRTSTVERNQFDEMGAVYLSTDGERWLTIPMIDGVALADASSISTVAVGPASMLAFGSICCDVQEQAAMWLSSTGREWIRAPVPEILTAPEGIGLLGSEAGFIAFGGIGGRAAIFTSPNGLEWTAVDADSAGLDAGGISTISRTDSGFIAAGWRDDGSTFDGALWESADGLTWNPIAPAEPFVGPLDTSLFKAIEYDGRWWLYGLEGPHEDRVRCENALGRVASVEPVPAVPDNTPHFSCGWGLETFWVSDDGRHWERLPVRPIGVDPLRGELVEYRFVEAASGGSWRLVKVMGTAIPLPS